MGPYVEIYLLRFEDALPISELELVRCSLKQLENDLELSEGDVVNSLELKNHMHQLGWNYVGAEVLGTQTVSTARINNRTGLAEVYTFKNEPYEEDV